MKLLYLAIALGLAPEAFSSSNQYKQCTVDFPDGPLSGECVVKQDKYIRFYTCKGELVAFIVPGALPTKYEATCGPTHMGFPGDKEGENGPIITE